MVRRSKKAEKHARACRKFHKDFIDEHGHYFCEICWTNQGLFFDPHHIYYASRFPGHPELHNPLNIIMLCRRCHEKVHAGKMKSILRDIEERRGLRELFSVDKSTCII